MATASLNRTKYEIEDDKASIIIVDDLGDIPGGRALDVTGITDEVIKAGHVIIKDLATGEYKPLPVEDGEYVEVPDGYAPVGILKKSVLTKDARAAILTVGQVNAAALPYPLTAEVWQGLRLINFLNMSAL